jgi:hypothetical protein
MMRAATGRMMWKAVAIAAAVAISVGLWLRRQEGGAQAEPRHAAVATDHESRSSELRARALDHTVGVEDRLSEAYALLARGTPLEPSERKAFDAESRRLRESGRPRNDAR